MLLRRNVGPKERIARIAGGLSMLVCGLFALHGTVLGIGIAALGAIGVITGLARYCPVCALGGKDGKGC